MKGVIFREYDIRGIVGTEFIIDESYHLGKAIGSYFKQEHPTHNTVIVARDGRIHSPLIVDQVIEALTDLGFAIIDIGLVPTPVLYFAVHYFNIPTALIITASHNPKEYNGVKIWGIWGEKIQAIKRLYEEKNFFDNSLCRKGTIRSYDVVHEYIAYLVKHFSHLKGKSLKAVIDCGNGAAGVILPQLIEKMEWQDVKLLYAEVDGNFPHHEADPTVLENMLDVRDELINNQTFKVGLGFDGDADRMNPMTHTGFLVPGDQLLALYAQKVLRRIPEASIVFDIKSSSSLIELLEQWKAKPIMSPSGHMHIKKAIKEHCAVLGGELSCHFFFGDIYFGYDDGIYAALRLFELLQEAEQSLHELLAVIPSKESSPEIRVKCGSDEEKIKIVEHVKTIFASRTDVSLITIDGMRAQMSYGWGLIRASNTQPVISLRFESTTPDGLLQVKKDFYESLSPFFAAQQLKKSIAL